MVSRRGSVFLFLCCFCCFYSQLFAECEAFATPSNLRHRHTSTTRYTKLAAEKNNEGDYDARMVKATKAMTAFTNKYLKVSETKLCSDKAVAAVVIKGLAEHKVSLGSPLCPCRFYEDKEAEAKDGFWNCPCVPMRERQECHCMLFLTEDSPFVGQEDSIQVDEVVELTGAVQQQDS